MKIIIIILILTSQNVFAQKDNRSLFNNLYEEDRTCDKIINQEYSQLLVGKWRLSHSLEENETIEEGKFQKFYFKKNGKFKEVREREVFRGTWKVCSCPKENLILTSNNSLISKNTLKELEKKGLPKGKRQKSKSKAFITIHKLSRDTLTTLFYMDFEEKNPIYTYYTREK